VSGRLVLVGKDPTRSHGGAESFVRAQARAARLAGYEPHIFCVRERTETVRIESAVLHRVRSFAGPYRGVSAGLHTRPLVRAIARELGPEPGPHVIHGFGPWAWPAVRAARVLERRGVPAVALATAWTTAEAEARAKRDSPLANGGLRLRALGRLEYELASRRTAAWERDAFHASRQVIVNYESVRRALTGAYGPGLPIRRMTYAPDTVIDPGAPLPERPEPLRALGEAGAPLIVTTSRHDGRKGLDVLIGALAGLAAAGVPFRACIAGGGPLLEAHRALVRSLGLGDRVTLPGRVPDVVPYLRHADIFVLPSTSETSGSVSLLEAMQAGLAVVSSDVDGMPEDLDDGVDGRLVAPRPEPLREALAGLLGDAGQRARLGAGARAAFERRFSPAAWARELRELYEGVGLARARA
jgi:glycosyltransferase involved in cell wall biosynthesis